MKKIIGSLVVLALAFGSTSLVSAKGPEKVEQKIVENKHSNKMESKESENKEKVDQEKSQKGKKETKKQVKIKSNVGKTLEKRVNASETSINNITKSINAYFKVDAEGASQKEINKKYNSYKGKLNSEINKLRALDKQLASKKYKSITAEIEALASKSKELQKLAADEIARVKKLAAEASTPETEEPTEPTTPTTGTEQNGDQTPADGSDQTPATETTPTSVVNN